MRLDARKGDYPYNVYHAERCEMLKTVVWVDDETHQWGEHARNAAGHIVIVANDALMVTHQEKKIVIYLDRRLIIINPVADDQPERITDEVVDKIIEIEPLQSVDVERHLSELPQQTVEMKVRW